MCRQGAFTSKDLGKILSSPLLLFPAAVVWHFNALKIIILQYYYLEKKAITGIISSYKKLEWICETCLWIFFQVVKDNHVLSFLDLMDFKGLTRISTDSNDVASLHSRVIGRKCNSIHSWIPTQQIILWVRKGNEVQTMDQNNSLCHFR